MFFTSEQNALQDAHSWIREKGKQRWFESQKDVNSNFSQVLVTQPTLVAALHLAIEHLLPIARKWRVDISQTRWKFSNDRCPNAIAAVSELPSCLPPTQFSQDEVRRAKVLSI